MPKLIIDPGHGGKDPGGGSNQYWKEKDLVLDISSYQYKRFKELGVSVALTRDKDIYLSQEQRTKIVKQSGADDCISNHINAGGGDGAETIHSIYSNGELARIIAEELKNAGQNIRRVFTRTLPYNPKSDYYFMHRDTGEVNTVIAEYGFADSKKDDVQQLLNNWQEYAEAVVKAYCRYIGHKYTPSKVEIANTEKEENIMSQPFKPSSNAIKNSVLTVLGRFEKKDPALSDQWRKQFLEGKMTISDAIGLLYVGVERGYITGKTE